MEKKLLLLSLVNDAVTARAVPKSVMEAAVFWAIRAGAKKTVIVNAANYQLIANEEEFTAAKNRGETESEVLLCDPASPEIAELAALNEDPERTELKAGKVYSYISPLEFQRDPEHAEHLRYEDTTEFESAVESFKKFDRLKPVYYIEVLIDGKRVKLVVDGWKYVLFAQKEGIERIFACKLAIGNNDDLISILFQLQRTYHDSFMALYRMIQALWPKYFKGQGHRSDINEEELDEAVLGPDGRRKNIYQLIGTELNLSGNKIKHIRKVGMVDPDHFERIEINRFSLYQAYLECVKEERGEEAPVPGVKPVNYITTSTGIPEFTSPTTTAGDNTTVEYCEAEECSADTETDVQASASDIPVGIVVEVTDDYVIVKGKCQHCGKQTLMKIYNPK